MLRSCLECDHRYTGPCCCPACGEPAGEPVDDAYRRPVGRPTSDDPRTKRGHRWFNTAEYRKLRADAAAAGMTLAAYVRMRLGV